MITKPGLIHGDVLELYRGDYSKISEFKFHKTDQNCLVGKGIYLTNSQELADTYRTKGSGISRPSISSSLTIQKAKDRSHAFELAFDIFLRDVIMHERHPYSSLKKKSFIDKQRARYRELIQAGAIKAEYCFTPHGSSLRNIEVLYVDACKIFGIEKEGYVTSFAFPKSFLEANTINVDKRINDSTFWELMFEHKIKVGRKASSRCEYVRINKGLKICDETDAWTALKDGERRPSPATYNKIRSVLMPYGIIGFEYLGGAYTNRKHRAFCIWDEEFVNHYKVSRIR